MIQSDLFLDWTSYIDALRTWLNHPLFYQEKYPVYEEQHRLYGQFVDHEIVLYLIEMGHEAQDGLDRLFELMLSGVQYGYEFHEGLRYIIHLFMDKGARPRMSMLFGLRYENNWKNFGKEMQTISIRGTLIDIVCEYPTTRLVLNEEWELLAAMYWEDIPLEGVVEYRTACRMALKYESHALRAFQWEEQSMVDAGTMNEMTTNGFSFGTGFGEKA